MDNIEYFKTQVKYWSKRLNIPIHHVKTDKRMWYMCMANRGADGINTIYYQPRCFKHERKYYLMHVLFHELGHFKDDNFSNDYPYDIFTNKMIAEYKAEKFALKCLKKYYPKYYDQYKTCIKNCIIKRLREPDYLKYGEFYFYAFSQLPEYAEVL